MAEQVNQGGMTHDTPTPLTIEFDATPDVAGMSRVKVDGRFYGLPAEAVRRLSESQEKIERVERELRCPIGLDEHREFCSAGTCKPCLGEQMKFYRERATAAEAQVRDLREALRELLESETLMPTFDEGLEAQNAWADRRANARHAARAALAKEPTK